MGGRRVENLRFEGLGSEGWGFGSLKSRVSVLEFVHASLGSVSRLLVRQGQSYCTAHDEITNESEKGSDRCYCHIYRRNPTGKPNSAPKSRKHPQP